MSWVGGPPFGGESRDAASETISVIRSSDVAIDSTAARLQLHVDASAAGSRCLKFLTATNASKAIVPAFGVDPQTASTSIFAFSGAIGLSALPSAAIGLISNATQGGNRYVRINTDGTFSFHNSAGTEIGPRSRTVVSTTGITEFTIFYDFISFMGSGGAIVRLYIGDKEELMFLASNAAGAIMESTTDTITLGEWLPGATNRGADFFLDDAWARYSTSIHDSPHLTPYPRPRLVGCAPPTAEGGTSDWTTTPAVDPNSFQNVDEYPNDGTTTTINTLTESAKHLFTSSRANEVTSAMTVLHVGLCQVGDVAGAAKLANNLLLRDASANETSASLISTPATTMVGQRAIASGVQGLARPAGGTWVYTDFDLSGGVSNLQFGVVASALADASPRVSNISGPYIAVSSANLEAGGYPGRGGPSLAGLSPTIL